MITIFPFPTNSVPHYITITAKNDLNKDFRTPRSQNTPRWKTPSTGRPNAAIGVKRVLRGKGAMECISSQKGAVEIHHHHGEREKERRLGFKPLFFYSLLAGNYAHYFRAGLQK